MRHSLYRSDKAVEFNCHERRFVVLYFVLSAVKFRSLVNSFQGKYENKKLREKKKQVACTVVRSATFAYTR